MFTAIKLIFINLILFKYAHGLCHLSQHWSGKWYQSKDMGELGINRTHFLNRGVCVEHKQDKFLFYESKEDCYRCVFIIQKHPNVLQYRATYCSDQNDFYANCANLSPESELITVYRESSSGEKCPLNGLYVMNAAAAVQVKSGDGLSSSGSSSNSFDRAYRSSGKCAEDGEREKESMIMECSDQSMLKLQFGKCSSLPTFIINCIAHWSEGNTNYLIGRVESSDNNNQNNNNNNNNNQKPTYKCIMYSEISASSSSSQPSANQQRGPNAAADALRQARHKNADFIDLANSASSSSFSADNIEIIEKSTLQISVSPDEFCRSIDTILDEQFSFTFSKVYGSRYHVAPPQMIAKDQFMSKHKRDELLANRSVRIGHQNEMINRNYIITHPNCKFPKWLNRKWFNFKQSKSFQLDYRLDSLFVFDEKNSVIINKYTCAHMKSKKSNYVQAVVKSLNGCSSGYQCLTIHSKSDYVLEIKFGKISYESASSINCNADENAEEIVGGQSTSNQDTYISREYVYVDTNYGVKCPLKSGIYEKLNSKQFTSSSSSHQKSSGSEYALPLLVAPSPPTTPPPATNEPSCKYFTQTQILQVGCLNEQQYSLRTRLCYPNHQQPTAGESTDDQSNRRRSQQQQVTTTTAYTQLESEINLVCLAHWRHNGNYVIVSRTMSNEILCSIWSSSEDGRLLQLLEIDSNCNYDSSSSSKKASTSHNYGGSSDSSHQRINYGFMHVSSCNNNENSSPGKSAYRSAHQQSAASASSPLNHNPHHHHHQNQPVADSSSVTVYTSSTFFRLLVLIFSINLYTFLVV